MGILAPPLNNRAQRFRIRIGNIAYSSGGTPGIPGGIPRSGYLTRLDLESAIQVVTGATAPVIANFGAYGPEGMVQVVIGPDSPYALPGLFAKEFWKVYDSPYTDSRVNSPIVTSSTNNWRNDLHIPLTVTPDTELGAWYTSDDEMTMDLQVAGATAAVVFSTVNGATIQGSWFVWAERFSAPPPDLPGGWLKQISYWHEVKLLQRNVSLTTGDNDIVIPRNRDYQTIGLVIYTGNDNDATFAPALGLLNTVSLVVSDETFIYKQIDEQTLIEENLLAYWEVPNAGFYWLDFMRQKENSNRDVLPTDAAVASAFKLTVNALSACKCDVIGETVMPNPYAKRWASQAAARQRGRKAA